MRAILGLVAALVASHRWAAAGRPSRPAAARRHCALASSSCPDAVVTDGRGRHVRRSRSAGDFEILQQAQKSRRSPTSRRLHQAGGWRRGARAVAGIDLVSRIPRGIRRTIAILGRRPGPHVGEHCARARHASPLLDKDVRSDDLVAIVSTGGGMSALQQFSSDRRLLDAAIDRLRWNVLSRGSAFRPQGPEPGGGPALAHSRTRTSPRERSARFNRRARRRLAAGTKVGGAGLPRASGCWIPLEDDPSRGEIQGRCAARPTPPTARASSSTPWMHAAWSRPPRRPPTWCKQQGFKQPKTVGR